MKAKVKVGYVDGTGVHKKGDVVDVEKVNPYFHSPIAKVVIEKKEEPKKKPAKASTKKTKK